MTQRVKRKIPKLGSKKPKLGMGVSDTFGSMWLALNMIYERDAHLAILEISPINDLQGVADVKEFLKNLPELVVLFREPMTVALADLYKRKKKLIRKLAKQGT
jgi:hypothetical protein